MLWTAEISRSASDQLRAPADPERSQTRFQERLRVRRPKTGSQIGCRAHAAPADDSWPLRILVRIELFRDAARRGAATRVPDNWSSIVSSRAPSRRCAISSCLGSPESNAPRTDGQRSRGRPTLERDKPPSGPGRIRLRTELLGRVCLAIHQASV